MSGVTDAVRTSAKFEWPLAGLFGDLRVRYGIKTGIASLLGLFCSLVLRLEHPNWSVLTVLVMMSSQHVGAISIKVTMRVVGTIAGAVLGIWLIGSHDTSPVFVLTGIFVVVAIATYKFGQYPASQTPYGYFLVGLTLISVATYGVPAPDQLWQTGLNRALENIVGALSALIVTTILWPRYAREEFFDAGRTALATAGKLLSLEADAYIHEREGPSGVDRIHAAFTVQLAAVRNLLHVGARESTHFRSRMANYNAFVVALNDLFQSAADLEKRRQSESPILDRVRPELEALDLAIRNEFSLLTERRRPNEKLPPCGLKEPLALLEKKIGEIRSGPEKLFLSLPYQVGSAFIAHYRAIHRVCDDLANIRDAMTGLPRHGQSLPEHKVIWDHLPTIDWFWFRTGIKGALATVIALVLVQSYNPPGPAVIPIAAWVFTIFSRPFLRTGGHGDLRAFQRLLKASLVFIPVVILLLLIVPALADYAAMCAALFAIVFTLGFFTVSLAGASFWPLMVMLSVSVFVGLNAQVPVPSISIIDSYVGLATGMLIAVVVGRLIWPVLPQEVFREDLSKFYENLKALLNRGQDVQKIRTQLAILPVEVQQAAHQIPSRYFDEAEKAKASQLMNISQALVIHCSALVSNSDPIPDPIETALRPDLVQLEAGFNQMLDTFIESFRTGDSRRPFPSLRELLDKLHLDLQKVRDEGLMIQHDLDIISQIIGVTNRYESMTEALEECSSVMQSMKLHRYTGDCVL